MKRDDSCVMQAYKDIPYTLTCVSYSVFWLDDNIVIYHILQRDFVLSRRYRFQAIDEVSRLTRPNVKVAALERRKARNVHGGVKRCLGDLPKDLRDPQSNAGTHVSAPQTGELPEYVLIKLSRSSDP